MTIRSFTAALSVAAVASAIALLSLMPRVLAGQTTPHPGPAAQWTAPRTPWGDPDLQGIWSNFDETPLEQPSRDARVVDAERSALAARIPGTGTEGYSRVPELVKGWDAHGSPSSPRRPSLIIDPPDGRVPLLPGPESRFIRDYALLEDSWEFHNPIERCITRGVPGVMLPRGYNNGYQIVQSPGVIAIVAEMIHDTRTIPIGPRTVPASSMRLWDGVSQGRWEGNTLVVETTNFNSKGMAVSFPKFAKSIPQTESLHVIERFTRASADRIDYQATFEDPALFARPWTVALPFNWDPSYVIFEYACHEGNGRYMEGTLRGGRMREKAGSRGKASPRH